MSPQWLAVITALLGFMGSGGLSAVIVAILTRRWKKKDEQAITPELIESINKKIADVSTKVDAVTYSQKVNSAERIRYLSYCYIGAGEITLEDKTTLHEMHKAYLALPGTNGLCDACMQEVDKLPIKGKA